MSCQCCTSISASWTYQGSNIPSEKLETFLCNCFCPRPMSHKAATGKWFPNLGQDPAGFQWMSSLRTLSFRTSHFLFTLWLLVQGHCLRRVCNASGGWQGLPGLRAQVSWSLGGWRSLTSGMSETEQSEEGRCAVGGPSKHMYVCSACLHAEVCVYMNYRNLHTLTCISWGKRKRSPPHRFLPGAPQMLLHALMAPVTLWWIGPGGLS